MLAFLAVIGLVLSGAQPGVAGMLDRAINAHQTGMSETHSHPSFMDHGTEDHRPATNEMVDGHAAAGAGGMADDHSCCPDGHDDAMCNGHCGASSWLACAIHCDIAAPAYTVAADFAFSHPRLIQGRSTDPGSQPIAYSGPPPFHPPKLFFHA